MFFSKELWLTHIEWIFTLALFPLLIFISPPQSFLLGLLLVPFLLRAYLKKPIVPKTPFNLPVFGLLIMVLISAWATYDLALSMRKISLLIWGICLFWSLQNGIQMHKQNKMLVVLFICGLGLLVSLIAVFNPQISLRFPFGAFLFDYLSLVPGSERLAKINPNEIGGFLTWTIPLNLSLCLIVFDRSLFFINKNSSRVLSTLIILSFLFTTIVLLLTSSRTAIGGGLLAFACMFGALSSRKLRLAVIGLLMLIVIMLTVDFFMLDADLLVTPLANIVEKVSGKPSGGASGLGTLNGRIEIWSRALYGIQDFSFTGMGMNTFREVVHILYPLFLISPDTDIAHAHNQFLQVALDLGLPGLIFYSSMWLILSVLLIRCWQRSNLGYMQRMLLVGLAGSMVGSFIFGLTDAIALGAIPSFVFWVLLALISSVYLESADEISW